MQILVDWNSLGRRWTLALVAAVTNVSYMSTNCTNVRVVHGPGYQAIDLIIIAFQLFSQCAFIE